MSQWNFVVAAYAVVIVAMVVLVGWSYLAMRRAEADADAARLRP